MYEEFIKEYKIFEKTKSDKNSEIIKSIIKTQKEIENANINYEFAEEDLVDYYAYQIKANQAKLNYLITMGCGSDKLNDEVKTNINNLIASRGGKNKILEGYGMTELGSAACSCRPNCNIKNSRTFNCNGM